MNKKFFIVFFLALFLRLILIPNPGFEADISFWKSWGLATFDKGIVEGLKVSNNNYPTPFAYVLGLVIGLYSLLANPHIFNDFWLNTNLPFLFVAKLPSILSDFGIAGIILWFGKHHTQGRALNSQLLAALYLLNPISLIDGAWWGQVDSLGVFIFLLAFAAALTKRPTLAGMLYMAAMMTKLQNMIYGPLFFLFIWQMFGTSGLLKAIAGSTLAFFGLNIEFLLSHNMDRVLSSLTQNYDYFPWMSLNAFNLWWIVAAGRGMEVSDKLLAIGIANAKTVGLLLFSSFYLFAVLRQFSVRGGLAVLQDHLLQKFLVSLIIVNAAFFLFQTESHDRYAFPLSVFLLLWAPFFRSIRRFFTFYALFTIFYFYNLHTALVYNYPNNGLPILSWLTQTPVTIIVSIALIALFCLFIVYIAKQTRPIIWIIPVLFLILSIAAKNMPLVTKKTVDLTSLSPYIYTQGYGKRTINMPVNGSFGIDKWSPLSVQYAFYRRGIGTHANSRMAFDIAGKFRRFTTDVGIDTEAGSSGSATFEIWSDDRRLYASDVVKRYELPRHADIDIKGVRTLTLVTTDGGDGITDDHTDWLNPKLYP